MSIFYINQYPTLYNFSLLYQISSSSCSEFGTGPSRCRSSLDLDKIFRRETISPLLGPQLKYNKIIELRYIHIFLCWGQKLCQLDNDYEIIPRTALNIIVKTAWRKKSLSILQDEEWIIILSLNPTKLRAKCLQDVYQLELFMICYGNKYVWPYFFLSKTIDKANASID